jgi:uncharacterized protein (TIGR03083 family)
MEQKITKAYLLAELRAARTEWQALMAEVGEARMTEPGATGVWSVKDVTAHLTAYNRWFVNASEAHFRGELPPPDGTEGMDFEERNQVYHQRAQHLSLAEVLAEWEEVYQRLLEVVEAHTEEFLTQPQRFEGVPEPVEVWKMLDGDGYGHYREHAQVIRERLAMKDG